MTVTIFENYDKELSKPHIQIFQSSIVNIVLNQLRIIALFIWHCILSVSFKIHILERGMLFEQPYVGTTFRTTKIYKEM